VCGKIPRRGSRGIPNIRGLGPLHLRVGCILCLLRDLTPISRYVKDLSHISGIGVISFFFYRDIQGYKMPSKYAKKFLKRDTSIEKERSSSLSSKCVRGKKNTAHSTLGKVSLHSRIFSP
jgi:hypothetical protein